MEKNTVCMDLDAYTNLVIEHKKLQKELEEFRTRLLPDLHDELKETNEEVMMLRVELIKANINNYRIENYSLEQVTNVDGWHFAIDKNKYDYLYQLGIGTELMLRIIKLVKNEFDAKKESEE